MAYLGPVTFFDLHHIMANLRPYDKVEVTALSWQDDPTKLVQQYLDAGNFQKIVHTPDGEPVALVGAAPLWPGCWHAWAFGTHRWKEVVLTITKHIRRGIVPAMHEIGFNRVQVFALSEYDDAKRWLRMMGAEHEATHRAYGKNGEDFDLFVWSPERSKQWVENRTLRQQTPH